MKAIGIDENNYLVYEGVTNWGHAMWPTATIIPAVLLVENSDEIPTLGHLNLCNQPYIFVDDGYDPASKVRKGRIFKKSDCQPKEWHVYPHPAIREGSLNSHGMAQKRLATFNEFNVFETLRQSGLGKPYLLLGAASYFTIWSIVDAETTVSGENILYFTSRTVIGAIPHIQYEHIACAICIFSDYVAW